MIFSIPDPDLMQQASQEEEESREQLGKSAQGESLDQEHQVSRIVIVYDKEKHSWSKPSQVLSRIVIGDFGGYKCKMRCKYFG